MARPRTLTLDTIQIPILEASSYSETIERVGGFVLLRTVLGSAKRQHNWAKHRITISGTGPLPSSLLELDHTVSHTLKLATPVSINSLSNVIALPSARRSDVAVEGYAYTDVDGYLVETPVMVTVDTATLTVVPGAVGYKAVYWPQFTVFVDPPGLSADRRGFDYQWTMNCEEA